MVGDGVPNGGDEKAQAEMAESREAAIEQDDDDGTEQGQNDDAGEFDAACEKAVAAGETGSAEMAVGSGNGRVLLHAGHVPRSTAVRIVGRPAARAARRRALIRRRASGRSSP